MAAKGASSVLHRPGKKRVSSSTWVARKNGSKGKRVKARKIFSGKGIIAG